MLFGGNHDSGVTAAEGCTYKAAYFADEELVSFVELNSVRLFLVFLPTDERVCRACSFCGGWLHRLEIAHRPTHVWFDAFLPCDAVAAGPILSRLTTKSRTGKT